MIAGRLAFRGILLIAVLGCSLTIAARAASAQTSYYWNLSTGAWDDMTADWNSPTSTSTPLADWVDGSGNTAIFSGSTAGTVTLGATVDPGTVEFNTSGYSIVAPSSNPSNYQINLAGSAPAINVGSGSAAFTATINANLTSVSATAPLVIANSLGGSASVNTQLNLGGTVALGSGSLKIVGNSNGNSTFGIAAPSISLSTLTFTSGAANTTTIAPAASGATLTFTGSNAIINSGEASNDGTKPYKDISVITETVDGPTGAPLTIMNNDPLGVQSAVSFSVPNITSSSSSSNSFVGGIAVESASSLNFNSQSLTATGTTRLNFNTAGANGSGAGAGPIYVYANGAIVTDQGSQPAFTLNMSNNVILNAGNITPAQGIFVTAIGGTKATSGNTIINYSGQISGNGSLLIGNDLSPGSGGAGVTIFSGVPKTYTGETIVNSSVTGILQMGATNVLPSTTTLMFGNAAPGQDLINSIGALDLNGYSQTITSLQSNIDPASTINGITNSSGTMATLTITGSTIDTFIGALGVTSQSLLLGTSNNNEALTRTGSGTTILGSAKNGTSSTYAGNTNVLGTSTLQAGSFTAFSPNSNYSVEATLDLAGYNNAINSLASTTTNGIVTSSQPNQNLNGQATILTIGSNTTLNAITAPNTTFLGVLQDGRTVAGVPAPLGLTKAGLGIQTLAGVNTYSGPTTINGGILSLAATGSLSAASAVTINSGGTLAGSGNAQGSVSINASGTVAPGSTTAIGALSVGSVTLFGGSEYNWKIANAGGTAGSGYDTVNSAGAVTLDSSVSANSPVTINIAALGLTNFTNTNTQSWTLVSAPSLAGTFSASDFNVVATNFSGGNLFSTFTVSNPTAGNLSLTYTPGSPPPYLTWVGGPGSWSPTGGANWNNGSSNGPWNSASGADFNTGSGTVNLTGAIAAPLITFDVDGYTIGGASSLTASSGYSALTVQVTNSGTTATINAPINSPLTKIGAGTLVLGGTNSFGSSNSVIVTGGTLQGTTASLTANINNNTAVVFDQSTSGNYSGTMSGGGQLVIQNSSGSGSPVLTLSGNNGYTGGTTINSNITASVAGNSNLGGASAAVTLNGGTLRVSTGSGINLGGPLTVTANGGTVTDVSSSGVDAFTGGGNLQSDATLTKNGPGILQISGAGWTGSGTIAINQGAFLVGNAGDPNSNPSAFLGGNSVVLNTGTTLTIAAGTAATASITPPNLSLNGNVTLALFNTGGIVGQGPLEPALNSATTITAPSTGSTITITGSGDSGNALAGSSNLTLGNVTFAPTSGTITIQTVAGAGSNGYSTGVTFGGVTDNGDTIQFLGQGNNNASTPIPPGPGVQFNGVLSGTTPTMTGNWIIGDPADTNGQIVVVAVQRVQNPQFALTTGDITVNPGSQLSITPALATVASGNAYGPASGTQTITLYGAGPTGSPGALTVAGKSQAEFNSNVNFVLGNSVMVNGSPVSTGAVEIDVSDGSSTQQTILTFDGPVTGAAGLDLQGGSDTDNDSQVIFAGNNNLTGHTTIKGGQIIVDSNSSIGTGNLTMGQTTEHQPVLILNNATQSVGNLSSTYDGGSAVVTQTIQLNGTALTINETDFTGTADYGISPTDGTSLPGSTSIITGTGSIIYAGAPASSGNPAAYLSLSGANTYRGGTTVTGGTLATTIGGTLGNGPLSLVAADGVSSALSLGANQTVASLSNSTVGAGSSTLAIATGSTLSVNGNLGNAGTLTIGTVTAPGATSAVGGGMVLVSGSPNLAANSQIVVNAGTLQFNATGGQATIGGSGVSVTVNAGATLQLAGTVSALSDPVSGNLANVYNNSSATGPGVGGLQVTGTNQSVGVISGTPSASSNVSEPNGPTIYSGDTVVGGGAGLTVTQILQNTLTIGAGATVTISPSGPGIPSGPTVAGGSNLSATDGSLAADSSDPLAEIQSAIASGSISNVKGEQLENRIAAIERLAAADPGLDVNLLESRVLASISSPSVWSSSGSSPLVETGAGLLTVDSSMFAPASGSAASAIAAFSPAGGLDGGITAVPEPSSLMLGGFGAIGIAVLVFKRRRTNSHLQGA
jgi:fibronectin-binding autotransporter adhesin